MNVEICEKCKGLHENTQWFRVMWRDDGIIMCMELKRAVFVDDPIPEGCLYYLEHVVSEEAQ